MKDLSIITVNDRDWVKLSRYLDSLGSITASYFTFEVIVVDNSIQSEKVAEFRQRYPKFTFISNSGNYGLANGNNLGATQSNGKYLLFLSPDTLVSERALMAMLDQAKVSRANSIISCRQVKENWTEYKSYGLFPSPITLTGWTNKLAKLFRLVGNLPQNERFVFPDWVSGSVMMMSKTTFNTIGKWNERFWNHFEDIDLCHRANEMGGSVTLLKTVSMVHCKDKVSKSDVETEALYQSEFNISRHEYFSIYENGIKEVLIHIFLVLNNLVLGFIYGVPGLILFSNRRCLRATKGYYKLLHYYFKAFLLDTWISPRSVKHPEAYSLGVRMNKNFATIGDENN